MVLHNLTVRLVRKGRSDRGTAEVENLAEPRPLGGKNITARPGEPFVQDGSVAPKLRRRKRVSATEEVFLSVRVTYPAEEGTEEAKRVSDISADSFVPQRDRLLLVRDLSLPGGF